MKKIAVFYLTKGGGETASKIQAVLPVSIFGKQNFIGGMKAFVKRCFQEYEALIFIMAAGIAVRMIAPCIQNKYVDPAVLVVDEKGKFVISLLSGHAGGANALAKTIAAGIGAQPVITTATDLNQVIAFDVFAKEQQCSLVNPECLKIVSGALADGDTIGFFADGSALFLPPYLKQGEKRKVNIVISSKLVWDTPYLEPDSNTALWLCPKNLVLGIGCKRGTEKEAIETAIFDFLQKQNRRFAGVKRLVSIDLKQDEMGILDFCKAHQLPFFTYPKEKLQEKEAVCHTSSFVEKTVGVGSVCEASILCAEEPIKLLQEKTIYGGITLALGEILLTWKMNRY